MYLKNIGMIYIMMNPYVGSKIIYFFFLDKKQYPKLYEMLVSLHKSENWQQDVPTNGKILMVNLIYEQFKKDGLI